MTKKSWIFKSNLLESYRNIKDVIWALLAQLLNLTSWGKIFKKSNKTFKKWIKNSAFKFKSTMSCMRLLNGNLMSTKA